MLAAFLLLLANEPASAVFADPGVPDAVLAEQRGGVRLPSGIDVIWTVNTATSVNGAVVLQTVVKVDEGPLRISTYAPANGQAVASAPRDQVADSGIGTRVTYDNQTGIMVTQTPTIGVSISSEGVDRPLAGLQQVNTAGPVATDNGTIRQIAVGNTPAIELQSSDLRVLHLAGNALGTAVANTGSDRTIDTQTTVSLDLRNAGPDVLGSTYFRVENVAIEAMSSRF